MHVLMFVTGLDDAGKTTILWKLVVVMRNETNVGKQEVCPPRFGLGGDDYREYPLRNVSIRHKSLGSGEPEQTRELFLHSLVGLPMLLAFVVDSSDSERDGWGVE